MAQLSKKLRSAEGNRIHFWCPGCKEMHGINVGGQGNQGWKWNGDVEKPTFSPSILVQSGHYASHYSGGGCWCTYEEDGEPSRYKCVRCHSFVKNGRIEFLDDSTHELKGQTVDLPDFE